jgi:transposase InsO family protein
MLSTKESLMVWKECSRVDERVQLVSSYLRGEQPMTALCQEFGVSRKTAYKWVARYNAEGPAGLADRSRAPLDHPQRVDATVAEALVMARKAHPHWGARKILAWLAPKQPSLMLPAASTVSALFAKYGLSRSRQARRRTPPYTDPFADADEPNRVWCADFKGEFKTGDYHRCYPLTLTDACSRMLLRCTALRSPKTRRVWPIFDSAFREYGLPERIRTDNGTPFASRGAGGLSRLSIWWLKLGIRHERIEPGHPEQNGRHERMHRTLKQETLRPPAPTSRQQQGRFDAFRIEYNEERPHEAIDNKPPGSIYIPSMRSYPRKLDAIEYPSHFKTRKVTLSGRIRWSSELVTIGQALEGEYIGIDSVDEVHHVFFADVLLGFIDDRRPELGLIRPPTSCWARVK